MHLPAYGRTSSVRTRFPSRLWSSSPTSEEGNGLRHIRSTSRGCHWHRSFITHPAAGSTVYGIVPVIGTIQMPNFQRYEAQYGIGGNPQGWGWISGPHLAQVRDGLLTEWDTTHLAPGLYTLRVTAFGGDQGRLEARVQVFVGAPTAVPSPTSLPSPTSVLLPSLTPTESPLLQTPSPSAPTALPPTATPSLPTSTPLPPTATQPPPTATPSPPTSTPLPLSTPTPTFTLIPTIQPTEAPGIAPTLGISDTLSISATDSGCLP
jgi:hypothetical protein